jgi:hypothetical protein
MTFVPVGAGASSRRVAAPGNIDSRIDQPSWPGSDTANWRIRLRIIELQSSGAWLFCCVTFGNQPKICAKRTSLFYHVIEGGAPWHQVLMGFSLYC